VTTSLTRKVADIYVKLMLIVRGALQ
jgi:hypothetical protein